MIDEFRVSQRPRLQRGRAATATEMTAGEMMITEAMIRIYCADGVWHAQNGRTELDTLQKFTAADGRTYWNSVPPLRGRRPGTWDDHSIPEHRTSEQWIDDEGVPHDLHGPRLPRIPDAPGLLTTVRERWSGTDPESVDGLRPFYRFTCKCQEHIPVRGENLYPVLDGLAAAGVFDVSLAMLRAALNRAK